MSSKVKYQALGPLMSGEGSRAFLGLEIAEDDDWARPVVLVWVPEGTAADSALVSRLQAETVRASALQHPNILRVHGLVAVEEGLARVVEFADGESLRRVLDLSGSLPERFAAFVAAEVAAGVHFAHLMGNADKRPLVHGDIRPETVMVSFNGTCKVSGYGALGVAPKESGGKRVKGRRVHCAPEQILGGRETATRETDVYLLGLLLYEGLTGLIPFGEEPDFDEAVVRKPLNLDRDTIPRALAGVLVKATAKRAPERYPSAAAFREAVERALGGLPMGDEFAAYLKPFFPEADAIRAARRQEIDAGIVEVARRRWEATGRSGPPPSVPQRLLVSPPRVSGERRGRDEVPPRPPRVSGERRAVVREEEPPPSRVSGERLAAVREEEPPPPSRVAGGALPPEVPAPRAPPPPLVETQSSSGRRQGERQAPVAVPLTAVPVPSLPTAAPGTGAPSGRSWLVPALVGASLAFGAAGLAFGLLQAGRRVAEQAPSAPVAQTAPGVKPTSPEPAPPGSAKTADAPPVSVAPTVAIAQAAAPSKPPPEPPSLELSVSPEVDIHVDGKAVGRSPVKLAIDAGKHAIGLSEPSLGIKLTRYVTVGKEGKTRHAITLGKATVALTAPEGAAVFMDGRRVGKAPVEDISVYEGLHLVKVTVNGAKWQQSFSVKPGDHMMFTVQSTEP